MHSSSLFSILAVSALTSAAPVDKLYQAPLDLAPLKELPAVLPVNVWSAGVNFESIKNVQNGHYCHVPKSKQLLSADNIVVRESGGFRATFTGTMPVAETIPGASMTIAVSPLDGSDRDEPRSHTAPISDFPNVVLQQASHGYDARVTIEGLSPFRNLAPGKHTVRLHAMVPNGRTLFCMEMDWTSDATSDVTDELDAWRGTRDSN